MRPHHPPQTGIHHDPLDSAVRVTQLANRVPQQPQVQMTGVAILRDVQPGGGDGCHGQCGMLISLRPTGSRLLSNPGSQLV